MTEENRVLDSYLESQIDEIQKATVTLAQTIWAYYVALKEQGFGDLQATELRKGLQTQLVIQRGK